MIMGTHDYFLISLELYQVSLIRTRVPIGAVLLT